jgi:two-component sensor histidine kinase
MKQLVGVVAAAAVLGIAAATWLHVIGSLEGQSAPIIRTLTFVMPFWLLWALYAPFVVWMTRHHPIERGRVVPRSIMHLGIAIAMSIGNTGIRFLLQPAIRESLQSDAIDRSSWDLMLSLATLELPVHVFLYVAILGVTYIVLYYGRLRERELAATRLRGQLADARVLALRMQLNPHFFFNTLNSVAMLVRDSEQSAAVETLEGLSDLLRYVLEDVTGQEVKLRLEIDFIQRYMAIEKIRFQDRLEVAIDARRDTLEAMVPHLVLQPLVENAIRYGVAGRVGDATVTVIARKEGDVLRLGVLDDGPGFSGTTPSRGGTGLGISNTQKRLAELYGDKASLDAEDQSPHGAAVTITLPFHVVPLADRELQ